MDNPPDFMALWDYQDPSASALRFHTLLPEARAAADLQLELELLTQIARTHSLQRQFAEAHQLLDEIAPRLTDKTPERGSGPCWNEAAPLTRRATKPVPNRCLNKPGNGGSRRRRPISPSTPLT